ncbi:uncharacterized protein LOC110465984 [Mizuhopecten yessoensis]|uniref:ZP domain-containing protein n=1 Tax=Mizuhopecten yessoensis TaxID=6573 RepID=A0A210PQF8_MIZYE|nr:uncharacterized protein LOC110465984 [Mizuhopecten yessoensis]OWF38694.1 hypothetical protein KP79_PYT23191 [Mizuhopecten yessoensis]
MESILPVVILAFIATLGQAQFLPTLTVNSCTASKLQLTLDNAADGGIIYIQGQTSACKQTTNAASTVHEFDFASCGIAWASSFKMIVQKKALYQTGDDKQIPIMCIMDLADLTVANNVNALDKDDDAGQNLTVKPTASMKLYRSGIDIAGSSVQLTDSLTMSIELDAEFQADFDIVAKECTASTISIVESSCAADTELFPEFTKPTQGYLANTFGAFRTTDLNGGSVAMTFSCTLIVCAGSCSAATCSGGNGFGRKKRGISKRQADPTSGIDDISVGASVTIAAEEVILQTPDVDDDVCMSKAGFIVGLLALLGALIIVTLAVVFMARKHQEKRDALNKLGGMTSVSMG